MNTDVDMYFVEGCGRCPLGGTPECKVHMWTEELKLLRGIILSCGLTEESKWGVPCYTFNNKNIAIVSAFKDYAAISFFKGALLNDEGGILQKPGENTQAARLVKLRSLSEVRDVEKILKDYIYEAIEVEKADLKVHFEKKTEPMPEEFQMVLDKNPDLKEAFDALTPGRQKSYILHFAQAKQSKTRVSRIEKCIPKIFTGKGFNEY